MFQFSSTIVFKGWLEFQFLKNPGVLFYDYITFLKNVELKNIIQWKNHFQNTKEKPFLMKEAQKMQL